MVFSKTLSQQYLDKRALFRLRLLFGIFILMFLILIHDLFDHKIGLLLASSGLLIGIGLGFLAGRMIKVKWHEKRNKVISEMDRLGVIILILYILFEYYRNVIFGRWLGGVTLTAFGFSILTGMMLGRFLNTKMDIEDVLKEKNVYK